MRFYGVSKVQLDSLVQMVKITLDMNMYTRKKVKYDRSDIALVQKDRQKYLIKLYQCTRIS